MILVLALAAALTNVSRVERPEWIASITPSSVTLTTRAGFHINPQYPLKFTHKDGAVIDKAKFTLEPCAKGSADMCVARASLEGKAHTEGVLSFSACDAERCLIEKVPLMVSGLQ